MNERNIISPWALRQTPPPPHRCSDSNMLSKEEGYTSKVGDFKCRSRPYYFRRCKKERPTSIESLPDELLFLILVCLPGDFLYDKARLVCRRWYHIIHSHSFINAHLQHSPYGLLYSRNWSESDPIFMTATAQGLIEKCELSYRRRTMLLGGCNGLVMEIDHDRSHYVKIINLATKQTFLLPSLSPLEAAYHMLHNHCRIAYAPASMEFKVAMSFYDGSRRSLVYGLAIVTAGVDNSWRQVRVDHLSKGDRRLLRNEPLISEGFIHWMEQRKGKNVLTLDVETEILTVSEVPLLQDDYIGKQLNYYYLSMGRSLSLVIEIDRENYLWGVWEMNPESKEWMKLVDDIKLGAQKGRLQQFAYRRDDLLKPIGWTKYPKVLAMSVGGHNILILYNLDTHEINSTDLHLDYLVSLTVNKNTLTWLT